MTWSNASSSNGSSCTSPRQTVTFFTFASRARAASTIFSLRSRQVTLFARGARSCAIVPSPDAGVEHVAQAHETEETARRRLPRAARRVVPLHLPGDRVRPRVRALARLEHVGAAALVAVEDGVLDLALHERPDLLGARRACCRRSGRRASRRPRRRSRSKPASRSLPRWVETLDCASSVMADELGHRELFLLEQRHEAHARRLGEELQRADGGGEGRHGRHPSIAIERCKREHRSLGPEMALDLLGAWATPHRFALCLFWVLTLALAQGGCAPIARGTAKGATEGATVGSAQALGDPSTRLRVEDFVGSPEMQRTIRGGRPSSEPTRRRRILAGRSTPQERGRESQSRSFSPPSSAWSSRFSSHGRRFGGTKSRTRSPTTSGTTGETGILLERETGAKILNTRRRTREPATPRVSATRSHRAAKGHYI